MRAAAFAAMLAEHEVRRVASVPDSAIAGLIRDLDADPEFTHLTLEREDALVSWACGVHLAGHRSLVMLQNSGLGNLLDALVSLPITYRLPLVMLVTWRGWEKTDEVQHWVWGELQNPLLEAVGVPTFTLERSEEATRCALKNAFAEAEERRGPVALLLRRDGTLSG